VTLIARMHRLARRQPHADVAIAATVLAVTLLTTAASPPGVRFNPGSALVAAVCCTALAVRRWWAMPAFLVSAVAAEIYLAMYPGHDGAMILAAPLIALYTVAEQGSRRHGLIIGILAVLALAGVHMLVKPSSWLGAENLALAAFGGLAVAAGDAARNRRAYFVEVEARASRAEADRETETARRVTEERLRIARDLHDVLGHQLALINVQAAVADHVLDREPRGTREALAHIRTASKTALNELRDTIGLLRAPDETATPTEPTSGLSGLPQLLASFRRAGLDIDRRDRGRPRTLPVPIDLTALRVVQESLTNVCKHAGPTDVLVTVDYRDDALQVVVSNRATGFAVTATGGHGLIGMCERVTALAGTLHAGPRPDGGYQVTVTLPLDRVA
jgi:signal transduction histidine kinase